MVKNKNKPKIVGVIKDHNGKEFFLFEKRTGQGQRSSKALRIRL